MNLTRRQTLGALLGAALAPLLAKLPAAPYRKTCDVTLWGDPPGWVNGTDVWLRGGPPLGDMVNWGGEPMVFSYHKWPGYIAGEPLANGDVIRLGPDDRVWKARHS